MSDYRQPYEATYNPIQERQETEEPKIEVGMQEDTEWRAEMREKGGYEEHNQKGRVETFEHKFKNPDADSNQGLMQEMGVAWRRISGSPFLPACSQRKVSTRKQCTKWGSSRPMCPQLTVVILFE